MKMMSENLTIYKIKYLIALIIFTANCSLGISNDTIQAQKNNTIVINYNSFDCYPDTIRVKEVLTTALIKTGSDYLDDCLIEINTIECTNIENGLFHLKGKLYTHYNPQSEFLDSDLALVRRAGFATFQLDLSKYDPSRIVNEESLKLISLSH